MPNKDHYPLASIEHRTYFSSVPNSSLTSEETTRLPLGLRDALTAYLKSLDALEMAFYSSENDGQNELWDTMVWMRQACNTLTG